MYNNQKKVISDSYLQRSESEWNASEIFFQTQPAKSTEFCYNILLPMWQSYYDEIEKKDSPEQISEALFKRIHVSEKLEQVHFDLIWCGEHTAGFVFYSIDGGIKNLIPAGYGYIMEIYIKPECRRRHIAQQLVENLCSFYHDQGCEKVYLTPWKESIEFWTKLGFADSGLIDPDNKVNIYIKEL